ncbi:MAG: thiol-disulfide isomerase, partial [Actinobacteria bacterium]|nr:thiol-disulfide isomerase [Actinomycetota bacterium]NIS29334.1 thiol-disulfide isomerase [Actinomycetota bacterium]NIU64710.1 thiol-disulfide isomerase [Actinomycetota bacterium]NIW26505.1 thiol-disulfide isomerase [Actinomycetota bacterium]NIX20117.1 thiol-disulfide isomerase [Actinomycetota bacterium]
PPWPARDGWVDLVDPRTLEEGDLDTFRAWMEAGMPEGDPAAAPEPLTFREGWQIGEPDLVLEPEQA